MPAMHNRFPRGSLLWGALAAATGLAASVPQAAAQEGSLVGVDEVRVVAMSRTVPVIGRLIALQTGPVAARTAGPVAEVRVEVGDSLKKGDVIAVVDTRRLRAQRRQLAASVDEAEARIEQAVAEAALRRQELGRLARLRDSAAFSQSRFEDAQQQTVIAERAVDTADALRASAAARGALVEIDIAWSEIEAPYPGVVARLHTQVGAWLGVGDPVVTMINDRDLEVEVGVPSNRLESLEAGVVVPITLDDGTSHDAVVRAIVPEEDSFTRTRQVRLTPRFGPTRKPLAVNQSLTAALPVGLGRDALTVHKDAIVRNQGQAFVYVAQNGLAEIRPVMLGDAIGSRFEVLGGLAPGDAAVVRGNERLRPGQPIAIGPGGGQMGERGPGEEKPREDEAGKAG